MKTVMCNKKRVLAWFLAVLMLTVSCFFSGTASEAATKKKVKSVTLLKPEISMLTLKKGTSYQLKTKVLPKKASNKKLRYRSSKSSVVSVSKKGKLKAKKKGKATITVQSVSGNKKAKVKVTVVKSLKKVKKVTLNTKKMTLYIGGTQKEAQAALTAKVSPKKATVKKVVYKASNKNIVSVSKKGVVTAKKEGKTKITVYAADGWGKKAVCEVTVKKKTNPSFKPSSAIPSNPSQTASPTPTEQPGRDYVLVSAGKSQQLVLDAEGEDYKGLKLVAECFQKDVKMVSDAHLEIVTDASKTTGIPIIAGSIGENQLIDTMIENGKLDVSKIKDKWETYKIEFVQNPVEGVEEALVIVGSDKRGTIYGIFHISELMGVSPWVYWADVAPEKKDTITLNSKTLCVTSEEPSVKYRGIFLNDEEPALGSWANNFFKKSKGGKFNEYFYENVFQLILRLKGNYLWPAMWSSAFSTDGVEMPEASAELADAYGIVMGTSHHEPMMKAHQEWSNRKSNYGNGEWNYYTNKEGLKKFFTEGAKRNGKYENVITIGMRGDGDAAMLPEGSSVEENVNLLKEIILDQKSILKENGLENNPTLLALYKEVEDYWYGDRKTPGLCDWNELDDTIVMLSEDNYGNIRTLPKKENKDRKGGWGMYYHVDYNGAPTSYQWVQTVQLQKMWEQMSMAYDYGVDEMWILNVGDLKPMESAISYFMDMAWDYDKWGSSNINSTEEYTRQWMEEQFGKDTDEKGIQDLTTIFEEYLKINSTRRAENVTATTYSFENYNEAMEMLARMEQLIQLAHQYKEKLPESAQAAYYELIYYPAVASANVNRMQIYAGLNQAYAKQNLSSANIYAALLEDAIAYDQELERIYDKDMPGGVGNKWDGMMYQAKNAGHVGYPEWRPQGAYPVPVYVEVPEASHMYLRLQGDSNVYDSGKVNLQTFTNINNETYYVNVMNGGGTAFDYQVSATADWIQLSKKSGTVGTQASIGIQADFSKVSSDSTGVVTITGNGQTVEINVSASVIDTTGLCEKTFVEAHNYISVEAAHNTDARAAANGAQWKEIKNYGRGLSSLKVFPCTGRFTSAEDAPYVEYTVKTASKENYSMLAYLAPSNHVDWDNVTMKFGVSVDGGKMKSVDTISKSYVAGTWRDSLWSNGVKNGIHTKTLSLGELSAGVHKIRIYSMDPEIVLQKFVLYPTSKALKSSYMGPGESYYVGKKVSSRMVMDVQEEMAVTPCTIKANEKQKYTVVVPKSGSYEVAIETEAEKEAKVDVLWNKTKVGQIVIEPSGTEDHVYAVDEIAMNQGKGELALEVTEGSANIKKVMINQVETVYGKPLYVRASSEAGTNYATNVYNSNARLIWKAESSDTKPYLEFDFDETVTLNTLAMTEKGSSVKGYVVMVQNPEDGSWGTVYTGTAIESGKAVSLKGSGTVQCQKARIVFTDMDTAPSIARVDFALDSSKVAVENYTKSRMESVNGDSVILTKTSDIRRIDFATSKKGSTYRVKVAQKSSDLYVTVPESEYKIKETLDGMEITLDEAIPAQKVQIVSQDGVEVSQITLWGDVQEERQGSTKEVLNQNFESNKDKISTWASATATIVTDEQYEGKQSLKISNRKSDWSAAAINIGDLCGFTDSQSEYTFSCYLKSGSGAMKMQVKLCNGSGSDQSEATGPSVSISGDEWSYFEYKFKMNSNEYQYLKLQTADGNTGDYYMDQVMITKPVPPCTCELLSPYITNASSLALSEKTVALEAEASMKRCDIDGHKNASIQYTYKIIEDESGEASLSGNKLTLKGSGKLVLQVTAHVNGITRRAFKAFEVK